MEQIIIPDNMNPIVELYYANNAKKLYDIVDRILFKLHFVDVDKNDFYSLANEVFMYVIRDYDTSQSFEGFLYSCLYKKFCTEMTRRNREKRKVDKMAVSLEEPIGDDDNSTIGNMIQSDFDMNNVISEQFEIYEENVTEFLEMLSDIQKEIALLIMKGYEADDIKKILNITDKQYKECWRVITSYDKKRILYKENNNMEDEKMNTMTMEENVTEKYKNTSYSIDSISKQLKKKRIRDDHILQRHSGQWKGFAKSELVSDILRGKSLTQIIISEEIKNGIKMQWLIDGKQRCTTLDDYLHDGFSISKNVKNYSITYQAPKVDDNGNEVLNEDGFTDMEWKLFDIRGKRFSQLPEELQDIFKDRQIPVLYNMNCTKKDIADDIARFNRSRPMNKAQNGWLGLEESFAEFVENIAKMQFFQPEFIGSTYSENNNTSGVIRRIIVESIMVSDFIENFGDFDKMCEFLSDEASDSNFTEFYSLVERLTSICITKEIAALFNAKDSFLWFGLFSNFSKLGLSDEKFVDFMNEFKSLRSVKVDGESFDDILKKSKSTKDKCIVIKKLNHLNKLMNEFLHISDKEKYFTKNQPVTAKDIVKECVDKTVDAQDMELYEMLANDISEVIDDINSEFLSERNRPSFVALVAYAAKKDTERLLKEWLSDFENQNDLIFDQMENYLHMKANFDDFILRADIKSA